MDGRTPAVRLGAKGILDLDAKNVTALLRASVGTRLAMLREASIGCEQSRSMMLGRLSIEVFPFFVVSGAGLVPHVRRCYFVKLVVLNLCCSCFKDRWLGRYIVRARCCTMSYYQGG